MIQVECIPQPTPRAKPPSWVSELVVAFGALGGAARYDDLYEYIQRTTSRSLTTEWKATVRRTIEDHSSDSKNFRAENLFRHLDHGFWGLRDAGDVSALISSRVSRKPKAIVDEVLDGSSVTHIEPKLVFVREHWRQWPSTAGQEYPTLALDRSVFAIVDGWITDRHVELKLVSGLTLKVPLNWYPALKSANRRALSQVEFGEYGIRWPLLDFQIIIPEILAGGHVTEVPSKEI